MGIKLKNNFFRVASVCPKVNPADVESNVSQISEAMKVVAERDVNLAVFPELCLTGYTCGDLFLTDSLIGASTEGLKKLIKISEDYSTIFVLGYPYVYNNNLYNMAGFIWKGKLIMEVGKRNIPNYGEFYEKRWFRPWEGSPKLLEVSTGTGNSDTIKIGAEICEDLWVPDSPSTKLCRAGAEIIVNLSASDDNIGKYSYLTDLIRLQSARCICAYVYSGAGFGESSTDLVFDGKTIISENGKILASNRRWSNGMSCVIADLDLEMLRHDRRQRTDFGSENVSVDIVGINIDSNRSKANVNLERIVSPTPFVPTSSKERDIRCEEIVEIQAAGLARRLDFTKCDKVIIGISGGLDSTLALLIACRAFDRLGFDRKGIVAVTMPGFGTTSRTKGNAEKLAQELSVSLESISIVPSVTQHFKDINHDSDAHDTTYENSQARMRTLILMDLANKINGMVIGTGDMSELALGWATYNGDHMSMYSVNSGIPKTLVRYLVGWFAACASKNSILREVLLNIIDTPVSPELLPPSKDDTISQVTEDLVGPYELHDFFLYYFLRFGFTPERIFIYASSAFKEKYPKEIILKWMTIFFKRFFSQQFKRSCMPDGPKVGSVCLSPRGDWRMPSDASPAVWLREIEDLKESI